MSILWKLLRKIFSTRRHQHELDLKHQSNVIPGDEQVHYSVFAKNENSFTVVYDPKVGTLYENFMRGLDVSKNGPCLGTRNLNSGDYQWLSYLEVLQRSTNFGSGIVKLGLNPGQQTFVGVYAKNCLEWDLTSLACIFYSMVVVPLYDTLELDAIEFIVNQSGMKVVVCDSEENIKNLLQLKPRLPTLKFIVYTKEGCIDEPTTDQSVEIINFCHVETLGYSNPCNHMPPTPDDTYFICYTSGTTGSLPKGVTILHRNLVCQLSALRLWFTRFRLEFSAGQATVSYLPLAHMFCQVVHSLSFSFGAKIGHLSGPISGLADDMQSLQPVFMPVVPRVLNKFYDKVMEEKIRKSYFGQIMFHMALKIQGKLGRLVDKFLDWLVFGEIKNYWGGQVATILSGAAPLLLEVKQFASKCLGAQVIEAYGQTEATGAVTFTWPHDTSKAQHVGSVLPYCWIKLTDVPDLEYFSMPNSGEICIKGPCLPPGYFKDPEKTTDLFDSDGWLLTGDIGRWNPNGTLSIIDRKKHLIKLSQGEYLSPEKLENVYMRCPLVQQIFVDGKSLESALVAVVVPDQTKFKTFDALRKKTDDDFWDSAKTKAQLLTSLRYTGRKFGLNSLEQIQAVHVTLEPFSVENNLLTPTLKHKRLNLRKKFEPFVDQLYKVLHSSK